MREAISSCCLCETNSLTNNHKWRTFVFFCVYLRLQHCYLSLETNPSLVQECA